jgi:hypothetical protein
MKYKRKKSRRKVKCSICTDARGGNSTKVWGRHSGVALKKERDEQKYREALEDLFRPNED